MSPKVSMIIPTYKRAGPYLIESLESAFAQTYPNREIIVVNDGSPDHTDEVLAPYLHHIHYIKQGNRGCAGAKNTGLAHACGDFITNLDDDDRIHPEKIARQVEMFLENPNLGICGTGVNFIDAAGQIIRRYMPPRFSKGTQVLQLLRRCLLVQSSVMIARRVHDHLGAYRLMLSEDYQFWLRTALHYEIDIVDDYLTDYRRHHDQITGPETRPELMAAVEQLIRDFIAETPMPQIIPGIQADIYGYALIGLLLAEQRLYDLSEIYLRRVIPNPAGTLVFGLLRLNEHKFSEAKAHFHRIEAAPFAAKAKEALGLTERMQAVCETPEVLFSEEIDLNLHPQVVVLRKEMSYFNATVIQLLLRLAKEAVR